MNAWQGFKTGRWTKEINVREFIQLNYKPYEGDDSFLAGATEKTKNYGMKLWIFSKRKETMVEH